MASRRRLLRHYCGRVVGIHVDDIGGDTEGARFAETFAGPLQENDCFVQSVEREVKPSVSDEQKLGGEIAVRVILAITVTILLVMFESAFAGDLQRLLSVKGMSCQACPPQVERELMKVSGVKAAHVDLKSGQAKVVVDERVKPGDLVRAVNNAGFKAEAEPTR